MDEILVENTYRNPEGNPVILDMILLDKVVQEPNIKLLLNTAVYDVVKKTDDKIDSVKAFCSQNATEYLISAPLFCDASGDGILGFLSGAAFRMGAESREEFNEPMAPTLAMESCWGILCISIPRIPVSRCIFLLLLLQWMFKLKYPVIKVSTQRSTAVNYGG